MNDEVRVVDLAISSKPLRFTSSGVKFATAIQLTFGRDHLIIVRMHVFGFGLDGADLAADRTQATVVRHDPLGRGGSVARCR